MQQHPHHVHSQRVIGGVDGEAKTATVSGMPVHLLGKLASGATHPAVIVAETLLLPLLAIGLGLLWAPQDPLQVQAGFPWPWLAPVVLALRYGPMAGLGGAVLSFDVRASTAEQARSRAFHVLDSMQVLSLCTNLGDTKTLCTHPASTSHGKLAEAQRQAAGIGQGLIRVAVGLEHLDDIKNDLLRGLDTLA